LKISKPSTQGTRIGQIGAKRKKFTFFCGIRVTSKILVNTLLTYIQNGYTISFNVNAIKRFSVKKKPSANSLTSRESVRLFAKWIASGSLVKGGGADKAEHCLPFVVP
jgi:hypothetical protein